MRLYLSMLCVFPNLTMSPLGPPLDPSLVVDRAFALMPVNELAAKTKTSGAERVARAPGSLKDHVKTVHAANGADRSN